jgi:hypothetical protein
MNEMHGAAGSSRVFMSAWASATSASYLFSFDEIFQPLLIGRHRICRDPFKDGQDEKTPEHIGIINAIMNPFAFFSIPDQTRVFQNSEMKGHFGLDHVQRRDDIADTEFAFLKKFYDPQSCFVRQCFKGSYDVTHRTISALSWITITEIHGYDHSRI